MWSKVAEEMSIPWRAAEAMHWQLGQVEMARRAGVVPFSISAEGHKGKEEMIGQAGVSSFSEETNPPNAAVSTRLPPVADLLHG